MKKRILNYLSILSILSLFWIFSNQFGVFSIDDSLEFGFSMLCGVTAVSTFTIFFYTDHDRILVFVILVSLLLAFLTLTYALVMMKNGSSLDEGMNALLFLACIGISILAALFRIRDILMYSSL